MKAVWRAQRGEREREREGKERRGEREREKREGKAGEMPRRNRAICEFA